MPGPAFLAAESNSQALGGPPHLIAATRYCDALLGARLVAHRCPEAVGSCERASMASGAAAGVVPWVPGRVCKSSRRSKRLKTACLLRFGCLRRARTAHHAVAGHAGCGSYRLVADL